MNIELDEAERKPLRARIEIWENEGGALGGVLRGSQYGRRFEPDRSWTIYHVFTGVPAIIDGRSMTGLSNSVATNGMICLNLRGPGRRLTATLSSVDAARAPGSRQ